MPDFPEGFPFKDEEPVLLTGKVLNRLIASSYGLEVLNGGVEFNDENVTISIQHPKRSTIIKATEKIDTTALEADPDTVLEGTGFYKANLYELGILAGGATEEDMLVLAISADGYITGSIPLDTYMPAFTAEQSMRVGDLRALGYTPASTLDDSAIIPWTTFFVFETSSPVIARIDGIASGGGYNAVEQEYNGSSFTDKTDGRTWGNDYNSGTGSYDARSLEAVKELNGNSVSTSYGIVAVDQGTKTFSVSGDYENVISGTITIIGSTGNDGAYTVSSATYDDVDEQTDIVVTENIPDSTVDGNMYQYDGMYVLVFPVPHSGGTQWFFESGLSEVAIKEVVFNALKNFPGYDPTVYQLLGHDDTPVMMWFSKGSCP